MTRCEEFDLYAGEWLGGERNPEVTGHLQSCTRCSAKLADLELIVAASSSLPELEPPERIWTSLRAHLQAEGLLRTRKSLWKRLHEFFPAGPHTALSTAMISALALVLLLVPESPVPGTARNAEGSPWNLARVSEELATGEADANRNYHLRDPQVAASYQQNLALVDNLIGDCQQKVKEDPNDEMAREYLVAAYRQKADLLNALSERDAMGD
ncbi:MAG TPA: hypothetical protein VKG84_07255 [Candidatus Acidoferrales bacterium]|nr:hypothetical protein [Candidatus Acidoferrales bacterium]